MARGEAQQKADGKAAGKPDDVKTRMNLMLQENAKRARLEKLRRETSRKIDFVKRKAVIEAREVYQVVREFFKEFLERRYEFTMNELRTELRHVYVSSSTRQTITAILDRLEAIEYANVHYTRDELVKILVDFDEAVKQLVHVHTNSKSLLDHLKGFLFKEPTDPSEISADLPTLSATDSYHVRIYTLIEQCYADLDRHRLHKAKAAYKALLSEYALLDDALKAEYYPVIEQTYRDLLNRARMLKG